MNFDFHDISLYKFVLYYLDFIRNILFDIEI